MDNQTWKVEEEERVSKQELRSALLQTACALNEPKCTQQAKALFKQYTESNGTFRYEHTSWIFDFWADFYVFSILDRSLQSKHKCQSVKCSLIRVYENVCICEPLKYKYFFLYSVGFQAICSRLCSTLLPSRMTTGRFYSACISMLTVTQWSGKLFEAWHQPRTCGISSCRCFEFCFFGHFEASLPMETQWSHWR